LQSGGADVEGGEEKINLKCLREGGIAAKATGFIESSREGEEGTGWKRVCKGDARVARGRGWAETARLM
jgi:hypothetical protein